MGDEGGWAHRLALLAAIAAGFWAADSEPAQRLFMMATQAIGLAGPIIGPLALFYVAGTTFLIMAVVYATAWTLLGPARLAMRMRR